MDLKEKASALIEVAKAYVSRGSYIQYDQRCMDRSLFLTPRRIKLIAPEAATAQKKVYLDCSSYVGAVFYEAFGYELPSDLTWHMIDLVKPRVYYYEFSHTESDEEKSKIRTEICNILQAGDVITYDRGVGSGHTMLYIGDGKFTHCTPNGRPDSYDYVNMRSREYDDGGLFIDELSLLFEKRLFLQSVRRLAIARPLLSMVEPTKRTLARLNTAKGLWFGVETSHSGMMNAEVGEEIEYRLCIKEIEGKKHKVKVSFSVPETAVSLSESEREVTVSEGESINLCFKLKVTDETVFALEKVKINACGMDIFVPLVLIGNRIESSKLSKVISGINGKINTCSSALSLAAMEYKKVGISIEEDEQRIIQALFYLHDSPSGDVLSRRVQKPFSDGAVYSFFGGTGVVTPEMISYPSIRINQISRSDFLAGDIIVISDDACGNETFSAVYTGDSLIGRFAPDEQIRTLNIEEIDSFFDSLLGRFCFVVLRPSLIK
ncbi:MAG: C40 family peptidase [Clostridia bacterium]|nr:C40 family peptidase [Clostridia bacterium]